MNKKLIRWFRWAGSVLGPASTVAGLPGTWESLTKDWPEWIKMLDPEPYRGVALLAGIGISVAVVCELAWGYLPPVRKRRAGRTLAKALKPLVDDYSDTISQHVVGFSSDAVKRAEAAGTITRIAIEIAGLLGQHGVPHPSIRCLTERGEWHQWGAFCGALHDCLSRTPANDTIDAVRKVWPALVEDEPRWQQLTAK
jgi:hypothetical protein